MSDAVDDAPDLPRPVPRFSDADVEAILSQAIAFDRDDEAGLRLDQLHAVADEIGVSRGALERAIAAHAQGVGRTAPTGTWQASRLLTAAIFVASMLLGELSAWVRPYANSGGMHLEMLVAIVLLVAATAGLIAGHRDGRRLWTLQLRLAAVWFGFLVGFSAIHGVWDDAVFVQALWFAASAMSVGLLPSVRRRIASRLLSRFLAPEAA